MKHTFIAIIISLIALSCSKTPKFEKHTSFENSTWHKDNIATFKLDASVSVKAHDIYIQIENNDDYRWSNLFLFTEIAFPDGQILKDTVECIIADKRGDWIGKGTTSFTSTFPYKANVKFPSTGTYRFSIQQAMRCNNSNNQIKGISSVGLIIHEK